MVRFTMRDDPAVVVALYLFALNVVLVVGLVAYVKASDPPPPGPVTAEERRRAEEERRWAEQHRKPEYPDRHRPSGDRSSPLIP